MARPGKPWYRESRGMWFFTSPTGRQVPTGVSDKNDEAGAIAARERLLAELADALAPRLAPPPAAAPKCAPVRTSIAGWLAACKPRVSAACYRDYARAAAYLTEAFGDRDTGSVRADELEAWARRPEWSNSYRNGLLGVAGMWLKWAGCPVRLRKPPKESRGADVALTDEQFEKLCEWLTKPMAGRRKSGDLAALLTCLRLSGARPQELAQLKVDQVDWANGCATLKKHKTAGSGKPRVIYFSEAALAILRGLSERYGSGFLFRTRHGNPYSNQQICTILRRASHALGFRACGYGMRHAFVTESLARGVPDAVVASLAGHTSTAMIHRNYSHVNARSHVLRAAVERAGVKTDTGAD
jgi:integrase